MRICQPPENSSVLRVPILFGKSQPAEDGADLRVEGVDVVYVELVGDVGVAVGSGLRYSFDFGSAVRERCG